MLNKYSRIALLLPILLFAWPSFGMNINNISNLNDDITRKNIQTYYSTKEYVSTESHHATQGEVDVLKLMVDEGLPENLKIQESLWLEGFKKQNNL